MAQLSIQRGSSTCGSSGSSCDQASIVSELKLFVSTEDAPAIGNLARAAAPLGWSVSASQIPRLNDGPVAQMKEVGLPAVQLTRLHFGQLLLALEADAWIGTYASNWCRLIDELRGVWVPKAAGPYIEVGVVEDYHVW